MFYVPNGIAEFKQEVFDALAGCFRYAVKGNPAQLDLFPADVVPVVSCRPGIGRLIRHLETVGRPFVYWDRGYLVRQGYTSLKRASGHGYFRFTWSGTQMRTIEDRPPDRWETLGIEMQPWRKGGGHVVVAVPSDAYLRFHGLKDWLGGTLERLEGLTDRPVRVRRKGDRRGLQEDLDGAHCMVTHGSIAAIEAVILGCPVFVDPVSAASHVGLTDLDDIEAPAYPDREPWAWSLAWSQFTVGEVVSGMMWRETVGHA